MRPSRKSVLSRAATESVAKGPDCSAACAGGRYSARELDFFLPLDSLLLIQSPHRVNMLPHWSSSFLQRSMPSIGQMLNPVCSHVASAVSIQQQTCATERQLQTTSQAGTSCHPMRSSTVLNTGQTQSFLGLPNTSHSFAAKADLPAQYMPTTRLQSLNGCRSFSQQAPQGTLSDTKPMTWQVQRQVHEEPAGSVYTGPSSPSPKRVTLRTLRAKYQRKEPITMVTAYDYPSAAHVDQAGIDILLIGDSVAMVVHGHDTTLPISIDEMLVHCRAAARGARRAFLVGDMPFGSYETGVRDAVMSAMRMLKEGGVDAVKLEGGSVARVEAARACVEAGVAVMGHVGLTPQSISVIGGFRPQAQAADEAMSVLHQAKALEKAGCFSLVLECVPAPIAAAITASVDIPTIGIGAGPATSGQVLVYHDLLGMMSHPHHAKVTPKFCKQYAQVGSVIQAALQDYRDDVVSRRFPSGKYSPYRIPEAELQNLIEQLKKQGAHAAAQAVEETAHAEAQQVSSSGSKSTA